MSKFFGSRFGILEVRIDQSWYFRSKNKTQQGEFNPTFYLYKFIHVITSWIMPKPMAIVKKHKRMELKSLKTTTKSTNATLWY